MKRHNRVFRPRQNHSTASLLILLLASIAFFSLLFLSVAFASPELRAIPDSNAAAGDDSLGIERESTYAYGNAYYENFYYVDARDAANTTASWGAGRLTLPGDTPALRGEYEVSETPVALAVSDGFAYVVHIYGFLIYDISDLDNVRFTGGYVFNGTTPPVAQAHGIVVEGDVAYFCAGARGLHVMDISDRSRPTLVDVYLPPGNGGVFDAVIDGDNLFIVNNAVGLIVLDISDRLAPVYRAEVSIAGVRYLDISEGLAVVAGNNTVATIDILSPDAPLLLDTHTLYGVRRIALRDRIAYATVSRSFWALDVANPTDIRPLSSSSLCDGTGLVFEDYFDDRIYVADGRCGVRLMDIGNPERVYTASEASLPTRAREFVLKDDLIIGVGDNPNRLVVMDRVRTRYTADHAVAMSNSVFSYHRNITDIRIETEQTGSIAWEVSVDGGSHWQAVNGGGLWNKTEYLGADLRWRAALTTVDGEVPVCTRLVIEWKHSPPPQRPGAVIRVRLDGTGDVTNLHQARDIALPGDTLVLGDGVFAGPENRGLFFNRSVFVRSEHGPEHTIIDGEGGGYVFEFRGENEDFHLNRIEGIQFLNAEPHSAQGTINADRCFLAIDNCIFRGGINTAIFTELAFVDVRDSKFIDCGHGFASRFNLNVTNCLFQGLGFGIHFSHGGAQVRGSTFFDNDQAIYVGYQGAATIENNTIFSNYRGIWMDWGSGNVRNNVIEANVLGIWLEESQALPISGNLIVRNTDAAMSIEGSAADIIGNTICDNEVRRDALINVTDFSAVSASNNLMAFNRGGSLFGYFEDVRVRVSGNNFFENYEHPLTGAIDDGDNQFADPLFCDRDDGQYLLSEDSPCLPGNNPLNIQIGARGVGCREKGNSTSETPIREGLISVAPNPFNPTTRIRYGVTEPGEVRLTVYDVKGRTVAQLIENEQDPGEKEIVWNAAAVSSGVYFARLVTPEGAFTQKLVVVK